MPTEKRVSFALKTNKHMDFKARNFITLICHDVSHNVSQTISCMVAVSKNHWFCLKQPIF